jgi:uncharacterized protein
MRIMKCGIGWRPELGASILLHLDEIDVVEVMAEDFERADSKQRRALRFLGQCVPVVVHATSLGLASTERVPANRLEAIARVVDFVQPLFWSEHLAFVRAGSLEVGHLAAPPRNDSTLEGLARNVEEARRVVGSLPLLENVASLVDPPLSTYDEAEWLSAIPFNLLLDLHNLHANATNFGFDALGVIQSLEPARIGAIHLAGGRPIENGRILDDHLHDVPDPVYELLRHVRAPYVILERDGNYPEFEVLLAQIRRARGCAVILSAVEREGSQSPKPEILRSAQDDGGIAFLARLYTDDAALARFMNGPYEEAVSAGFDSDAARHLATIDLTNLTLAARSFARKRSLSHRFQKRTS